MAEKKLSFGSGWGALIATVVVPVSAALIVLYSDVRELKSTKADKSEMYEVQLKSIEQMTKNTEAIKNLNNTLERLGRINGKE